MSSFAVPSQLRCQLSDVHAELADLFRRLGEIMRIDLHLGPPTVSRLGVAPQSDATGYTGHGRAAGQQRSLCLARNSPDTAGGVAN